MAGSPGSGRLKYVRQVMFCLAAGVVRLSAADPIPLSLVEVSSRVPPKMTAAHLDQVVLVQGVVNHSPYHFPGYAITGIQDEKGSALLEAMHPDSGFDVLRPGQIVQATGKVTSYAGVITIAVDSFRVEGRTDAPAPLDVRVADLARFQGRLVRASVRIKQVADTTAGSQLLVDEFTRIFLPRPHSQTKPNFSEYNPGEAVQVTGIGYQYCPHPPYTTGFEVLIDDPAEAIKLPRPWSIPPFLVLAGLAAVVLTVVLFWNREHRLRKQRERLRRTYQLGEEILGAPSAEAILQRIMQALPGILQVTRVRLYVHNRSAKTLEGVSDDGSEAGSISLSAPPAGTQAGAVACFHYRTLLVIPDIDRSPFPMTGQQGEKTPKSLLFVPMVAQGEVIGVLELDQYDRLRDFSSDEQALAQHLGNQIGAAIRLLEQRSVQEQLSRTEKLAAVGRLISGVVNELQTRLSSISDLALRAQEKSHALPPEREVAAIAAEAHKASAMVSRLVSFASAEQVEARQVQVGSLIRNLIEFRESDWKAQGIRVLNLTSAEPFYVLGLQGQLEQVFLNLLVHAEQALAEAPQKVITVRTSVLAKRLLVEIGFSAPSELRKPEETAAVLGVTRSVVAGHGGEVRLIDKNNSDPRFEVELPISARDRSAPAAGIGPPPEFSRQMTAMVIEPDEAAQRQILALLSARGFRVVPADTADKGLELAQRMRFDAAFCSVHAHGLNWVELSERMHSRVGGFVLLSDGYDAELSADFEGDGRFVLSKPVQETELDRILRSIDRLTTAKVISIKNGVA